MRKNKKELLSILLDLHYKYSMNKFEEFYGDSISYSSIEQESYIDFKEMSFEKINREIKFRKFGRQGNILTIKMDINPVDYDLFLKIFKGDLDNEFNNDNNLKKFNFLHDFEISNIRKLTTEENILFKKLLEPFDDDDDDDDDDEIESFSCTEED